MSDTPTTPTPASSSRAPQPVEETAAPRYAAYDETALRFVGGVHDTKAKAKAAAKDRGVTERVEIREV